MRLLVVLLLIIVVGIGIASRLDNLRRNAQWQRLGDFFSRAFAQGEQQEDLSLAQDQALQDDEERSDVEEQVDSVFGSVINRPSLKQTKKKGEAQDTQDSQESRASVQQGLGTIPLRSLYERISVNDALLQNLAERTDRLGERERTVEARETILAALQKKVEEREKSLQSTRSEIKALLERYEGEQSGGLKQLIGIYSTIEPKRAAAIFNELDLDIVVSLLRQMPSRRVAPILAAMDADKARRITLELSE